MSRSRIKVKIVIPAIRFGIYIIAFYYFLTEILKIDELSLIGCAHKSLG
jgi:hypothetical protein